MAKLYFYYSAMNAGKSTVLLQSSYNYQERGMDTLLYSPSIDDRYGIGKITSRIGLSAEAKIMENDFDIYSDVKAECEKNSNITCILVDEAQFLTKLQVEQLCRVVDDLNKPVLCYGLRTDFQAVPFEGSLYLLAWADNIVEVKTVCHCGRKASMNMRVDSKGFKVQQGAQIQVGGNDMYVSTCRKHFNEGVANLR